jgi:uncharacterized protein
MRVVRWTAPTPPGFGLGIIGVPEGSPVELDLRLEAVMEGVLVTGQACAPIAGECARCLDPVHSTVEVEICELYAYPGHESDDDDIGRLDGDLLDFEPRLRDAVVLALPLRPVCAESCEGLCATCGIRLADEPAEHTHDDVDPRWAALRLVPLDTEESER